MKTSTSTQTKRGKLVISRDPESGKILRVYSRERAQYEAEFWSRVKVGKPNECWEWQGARTSKIKGRDYGSVWINGVRWKTHRLAWFLTFGPPKHLICHDCDNPPCCNPSHLFDGTTLDNALDCIAKGRGNRERGEDRYNATLTANDIAEIRRRYKFRDKSDGGVALAKEFGVGKTMISSIVCGHRWKHVTKHEP